MTRIGHGGHLIIGAIVLSLLGCNTAEKQDEWTERRHKMVRMHIEGWGIRDAKVIEAMRRVPRHRFVPEDQQSLAYRNHPLPIGYGQTISQPYIVGLMTECLKLQDDDKVLEIGTGSGYQAAILGELVKDVFTIEIVEPLGLRAQRTLRDLGYSNIHVRIGDGYAGWPEEAPFDAIIVTAAPPFVPEALKEQLAVGARMVLPVGTSHQELLVIERTKDGFDVENIARVAFVPMVPGAHQR